MLEDDQQLEINEIYSFFHQMRIVKLKTDKGDIVEIDRVSASLCRVLVEFMKNEKKRDTFEINNRRVTVRALERVVEWCVEHAHHPKKNTHQGRRELNRFDANFVKVDMVCAEVLTAADLLGCFGLARICSRAIITDLNLM